MRSKTYILLLLSAATLLSGCRDKEREALERQKIEMSIEKREATIAATKKEATDRFEKNLAAVPPFDREAARKKLVLDKLKIDLDKTELKTREQAKALLEARAVEATDQRLPPSRRKALVAQALEDYPLHQVGDVIAVSTRTGRGAKGQIESIDNDYVKIGRTKVFIADIESPDPVSFSKERCEKQRRYVVHLNYDAPRRDELIRQRKRLLPQVFRECGYVFHDGAWKRVDELYKGVIDPLIKKQEETYWKEAETKIRKDVETELLKEGRLPFPDPIPNPYAEKD